MQKEELLRELVGKLQTGEIATQEVARLLTSSSGAVLGGGEVKEGKRHITLARVLYALGAAIVILGIAFFIWQIWVDIGSALRIAITLGLGVVLAIMGSVLITSRPESKLGEVFHVIGAVLIPGGIMVLYSELRVDLSDVWPLVVAALGMNLFYGILTLVHRRSALLTFLSIIYGTAFLYFLVAAVLHQQQMYYGSDVVFTYLTMAVGVAYLLFSNAFMDGFNKPLVGTLRFLGSVAVLSAAFSRVFESGAWQVVFFFLTAGGMWLAVRLKSKGVLTLSTLFLIGHFIFITGEYFADSIGWPVSLVILGLVLIGLGYFSVNISKKYISTPAV